MKKTWILLLLLIFFNSCSDVGKVLRNEKTRSTDEFLVKKKGPLVFPPNYEVVPSPDSISNKDEQKNIVFFDACSHCSACCFIVPNC